MTQCVYTCKRFNEADLFGSISKTGRTVSELVKLKERYLCAGSLVRVCSAAQNWSVQTNPR